MLGGMKNIQLSSPESDRKIARVASIIFMSLFWLAVAAFLVWLLITNGNNLSHNIVGVSLLSIPLLLIPIQLWRYFKNK